MIEKRITPIKGKTGIRLSLYTGMLERGFDDRWSSEYFYHAYAGDYVEFVDELSHDYELMVAEYSLDVDENLIYTYCYQPEENWTTYKHNMTPASYTSEPYYLSEECYIRVNIRRRGEGSLELCDVPCRLVSERPEATVTVQEYFRDEIEDTVAKLNDMTGRKYLIIADSHYVINGTWDHTIANIREVVSRVSLDGIIHLGDFTDGLVSGEVNRTYVDIVYKDLNSLGLPVYVTLGNHDSNYFHNNPDTFTPEEQNSIFLSGISEATDKLYYYRDDSGMKVRMIFLHSHDFREQNRYGYSDDELQWFRDVLSGVPTDYKVMVFSHVPPLAKYHFWSDVMRNGEEMMEAAVEFNLLRGNQDVIAWIHGHNHGDAVWNERGIPVISLGCNKCEYFEDKKPEGTKTYPRKLNSISEDLWDIMNIDMNENRLTFVRFGAGEDREIQISG